MIASTVGGIFVVGLLAGSYPALVLSRVQPARVLQGFLSGSRQQLWLRKELVVAQFGVAVALVIGVAVILRQFTYMQNQNLGFQDERVLVTDLRPVPDTIVAKQYRAFPASSEPPRPTGCRARAWCRLRFGSVGQVTLPLRFRTEKSCPTDNGRRICRQLR